MSEELHLKLKGPQAIDLITKLSEIESDLAECVEFIRLLKEANCEYLLPKPSEQD